MNDECLTCTVYCAPFISLQSIKTFQFNIVIVNDLNEVNHIIVPTIVLSTKLLSKLHLPAATTRFYIIIYFDHNRSNPHQSKPTYLWCVC